jgi:hypothetical protein
MPGQFFLDQFGQKVVLVKWDMGEKHIDIEYGGIRLTRLNGPGVLLGTGMQGQTPDGRHLFVTGVRPSGATEYTVVCDGVTLTPSPIDYAMHPPVTELVDSLNANGRKTTSQKGMELDKMGRLTVHGSVVDDTVLTYAGSARKVNWSILKKAQTGLLVRAIGGTIFRLVVLAVFVLGMVGTFLAKAPVSETLALGAISGLMIVTIVLNWLAYIQSRRELPSFTIAKVLSLLINIGNFPIGWVYLYFRYKTLDRAQDEANNVVFNAERARFQSSQTTV